MKAVLLLVLCATPVSAGMWSRVSETALRFEGDIVEGEYDRFASVYSPTIREVVVNSGGGRTEEALRIGLVLVAAGIKITVEGRCLSSCANYLFVAGKERELRKGVVGFHGNVYGCFGGPRRQQAREDLRQEYNFDDKALDRIMADQDKEIAEEARFLALAGVSQELFTRSCTPDKGRGDGRTYAFLLPKPQTFDQYGLKGVVGVQDESIMKTAPWSYAHD